MAEKKGKKKDPKEWRLQIDAERCKGCGFCVEFCPKNTLAMSDEFNSKGYHPPLVADADSCTYCDLCEMICPEFAIYAVSDVGKKDTHLADDYVRMDRMPHIWCPGCGIGTVVNCLVKALIDAEIPRDKTQIVSGIGCTGRVAGYVDMDSYHTTHGRAIPFATGLALGAPDQKVVVVSGDGDLTAIGGNHFFHAARRNANMTVICVNNFNYGMTGGQVAPTTPETSYATTTPYGAYEKAFNIPFIADSCGASYVARWTTYHVRHLQNAIKAALLKPGFSLVEAIAPCPTNDGRRNKLGDGLDMMKFYKEKSERLKKDRTSADASIDFQDQILIGKFVDRDRPSLLEAMDSSLKAKLGDNYVQWPVPG
ncbi:MAG: 4Fe-4S dicluster domain-containing protein [Proteobacteria bacterium]|nr:4Fe-4S dicluster domain-containing protein [Pseudomonadota bacterium]